MASALTARLLVFEAYNGGIVHPYAQELPIRPAVLSHNAQPRLEGERAAIVLADKNRLRHEKLKAQMSYPGQAL